jgi:hypothetical protein
VTDALNRERKEYILDQLSVFTDGPFPDKMSMNFQKEPSTRKLQRRYIRVITPLLSCLRGVDRDSGMCVCVCVSVCARARARACMCVIALKRLAVTHTYTHNTPIHNQNLYPTLGTQHSGGLY